jgi:hypothetical protein
MDASDRPFLALNRLPTSPCYDCFRDELVSSGPTYLGAKQPVLPTEELWQLRLRDRSLVGRLRMSQLGRELAVAVAIAEVCSWHDAAVRLSACEGRLHSQTAIPSSRCHGRIVPQADSGRHH